MKKLLKSRLFTFILGLIIAGGIGVYATSQILASDISYRNGTVESALNDLYDKANNASGIKLCKYISGTEMTVGAKYECTLGDKDENDNYIKRNFYILSTSSNNTVDMIMDRNITESTENKKIVWSNAINYFNSGQPGYKYTTAWTNVVSISLPSSVSIARAVNNNSWNVNDNWFCFGLKDKSSCIAGSYTYSTPEEIAAAQNYRWLFNYTADCTAFGCDSNTNLDSSEASGYWCKDNWQNSSNAMSVDRHGRLNDTTINNQNFGIRPSITVLKSSLYK